jgi:hypothetical protein
MLKQEITKLNLHFTWPLLYLSCFLPVIISQNTVLREYHGFEVTLC